MPKKGSVQHTQDDAAWRAWTNAEEDQRLIALEGRIALKSATLQEAHNERRKIMMRAIRRMRRAGGKT